ncbi:MAG: purine-nucleoside phosphorylase [Evtepia sp.]
MFGTLAGLQPVAVMQGRMHHYEGYSYEEVAYAVRVLRLLGCQTLFVTNAAGGVNYSFHAGDLMLITDQIKIFMESPCRGENLPEFGVRFLDCLPPVHPRLQAAGQRGRPGAWASTSKEGVYMYFPGPSTRRLRRSGLRPHPGRDAVGMSTAPEVIAAGHCGMEVLGITLSPTWQPASWTSRSPSRRSWTPPRPAKEKFSGLLLACLAHLDEA